MHLQDVHDSAVQGTVAVANLAAWKYICYIMLFVASEMISSYRLSAWRHVVEIVHFG